MTEQELTRKIYNSALTDKSKDHIKEKLTLFAKMEKEEATADELIELAELFGLTYSNISPTI